MKKKIKIPVNLLAIHTFIGQPRYLKVLGNTQIMSFYNTEKLCQIDIVTDRLEYFRFYAERMAEKSWNCYICIHDVTETRRRALYLDGDRLQDESCVWLPGLSGLESRLYDDSMNHT